MMRNAVLNLQDLFLNTSRKEKIAVTVYMLDGSSLDGVVKGFDSYIVLLEKSDKSQQMIYKHAIASIKPSKYIGLGNNNQNK
jgi:host factor-I protein